MCSDLASLFGVSKRGFMFILCCRFGSSDIYRVLVNFIYTRLSALAIYYQESSGGILVTLAMDAVARCCGSFLSTLYIPNGVVVLSHILCCFLPICVVRWWFDHSMVMVVSTSKLCSYSYNRVAFLLTCGWTDFLVACESDTLQLI